MDFGPTSMEKETFGRADGTCFARDADAATLPTPPLEVDEIGRLRAEGRARRVDDSKNELDAGSRIRRRAQSRSAQFWRTSQSRGALVDDLDETPPPRSSSPRVRRTTEVVLHTAAEARRFRPAAVAVQDRPVRAANARLRRRRSSCRRSSTERRPSLDRPSTACSWCSSTGVLCDRAMRPGGATAAATTTTAERCCPTLRAR